MRVLRLGNSNDTHPQVAEGARSYAIAEQMLAEASGETVETIVRTVWPSNDLPDLIDEWLDRYDPDIVFIKVSSFWYSYESAPLKVERRLGGWVRPLTRAAVGAAGHDWVRRSRWFAAARKLALRTVGGETYFTPVEVVAQMEQCARRVLARERIGLVIRGSDGGRESYPGLTRAALERRRLRRAQMREGIKAICDELHVVYSGRDDPRPPEEQRNRQGRDRFHRSESSHRLVAKDEGEALIRAWRRVKSAEN